MVIFCRRRNKSLLWKNVKKKILSSECRLFAISRLLVTRVPSQSEQSIVQDQSTLFVQINPDLPWQQQPYIAPPG